MYGSGEAGSGSSLDAGCAAGGSDCGADCGVVGVFSVSPSVSIGLSYGMAKKPRKPTDEDFNEAAFRVVREATEEREPEPQADGDSGTGPQAAEPARKPS